jgi:hypothetical protein
MTAPFLQRLSPIPIVPGEKRPRISGWDQYVERQPTSKELLAWAGVGIVLGTVADCDRDLRLVALDVDHEKFVEPVRKLLFAGAADALRVAKKAHRRAKR